MNDNKKLGEEFGKSIADLSTLVTLVFCALRACDIIKWKWYWLLAPVFARYAICIVLLLIIGIIASSAKNKKEDKQ